MYRELKAVMLLKSIQNWKAARNKGTVVFDKRDTETEEKHIEKKAGLRTKENTKVK